MKSIKEKSNEYATEFVEPFVLYYTKDEVRQFKAQHEDSFEAGANYVLEHLSMTISVSEDSYLRDNLKKMIEQLKKK